MNVKRKERAMPNHITNCLTINGEESVLSAFLAKVIKKDKDGDYFDFEVLIPPPEDMFRGNLSEADRKQCHLEGRANWYDWQVEHWGTKWNAYDFKLEKREEGKVSLRFDTAWAPPEPIFEAIQELGLEVSGLWKDEGDDEIHPINGDYGNWYTTVNYHCD